MTAHEFLDRLEKDGLVDRAIVSALRRKISQPGKELSAEKVANFLVSKGHLTENDAQSRMKVGAVRELSESDLISDPDASKSSGSSSTSSKSKKSSRRKKKKQKADSLTMLSDADVVEEKDEIIDLAAAHGAPVEELASLDELVSSDPLGMEGGGLEESKEKKKKSEPKSFAGKQEIGNQWDSKWILIGPTVFCVLLLGAGFLWFLLSRGDATESFNAFLDSYRGQRYTEAIERGTEFLEDFEKDENAETVRVYTGIAKIRIPVESHDWDRSRSQLQKVLPDIDDSEEFSQVRDDVPFLILETAEGFAEDAEEAAESDIELAEELKDKAQSVMDTFANKSEYITGSQRRIPANEAKWLRITEMIERVNIAIETERELEKSLEEMDVSIANRDTVEGFGIQKDLLRRYPNVESDRRLVDKVLEVSRLERNLVTVTSEAVAPFDLQPNPSVVATHITGTITGRPIPSIEGEIAPVLLNGTVFAVNAGSGQVIWRKFVGIGTEYSPQWIDRQSNRDLLVINSDQRMLMRVDASTGDTQWSTIIDEAFAEPVIANDRAYLSTDQGSLIEVDLSDGTSSRRANIPQPLFVGPATGARSQFLFQPGLHSNLYKISSSTLECQEAFYLGHAEGSIAVPPVVASGYVFVAVNSPAGTPRQEYSQINILLPGGEGMERVQPPLRLSGKVVSQMLVYQRKVLIVTDLGDIVLLDVDVTNESRPVTEIAKIQLNSDPQLRDYYAAENGWLFVADRGLTGFQILAQKGEFDRKSAPNNGEVFVAPLQFFGEYLIHARYRRGSSLVSISAVHVEDAAEAVWRIDLGAPLAGPPIVNEAAGNVMAVSSQGDQFIYASDEVSTEQLKNADRRGSTTQQDLVFHYIVELGEGKAIGFGPGNVVAQDGDERQLLRLLSINPEDTTFQSKTMSRQMIYDHFRTAPVIFGSEVLVPSAEGQVFLIDPLSGADVATPFQPAIEPGNLIEWCRPVVLDAARFVVGDARGILYLVGREAGDQNSLRKLEDYPYEHPFVSPLAMAGGRVAVIADNGGTHELTLFNAAPLGEPASVSLNGRATSEPFVIGDLILVSLDDQRVHAYNASDLSPAFEVEMGRSAIVGQPVVVDGEIMIASNRGVIRFVDAETGELNRAIDVGEPITHEPRRIGDVWVVGALDGSMKVLTF